MEPGIRWLLAVRAASERSRSLMVQTQNYLAASYTYHILCGIQASFHFCTWIAAISSHAARFESLIRVVRFRERRQRFTAIWKNRETTDEKMLE
jgi:hypothetical protein